VQESNNRRVPVRHTVAQSGFQSAGSALKQMMPALVVSKQKLRQAEGSCLVRIKRKEKNQTLASVPAPLFFADCLFADHQKASCYLSDETGASSCRSPGIHSSACRLDRTA
jgi:hypothetical protein